MTHYTLLKANQDGSIPGIGGRPARVPKVSREAYSELVIDLLRQVQAASGPILEPEYDAVLKEMRTWAATRVYRTTSRLTSWLAWWKARTDPAPIGSLGEVQAFVRHLESRRLRSGTILDFLGIIRQTLGSLRWPDPVVEEGLKPIFSRLMKLEEVRRVQPPLRKRPFRWGQIQQVLTAVDPTDAGQVRNATILLMLYDTLSYPSELLGRMTLGEWGRTPLSEGDIQRHPDGSARVWIGFGPTLREAYLSAMTMTWLDRWLTLRPRAGTALFTGRFGQATRPEMWQHGMTELLRRAGLPTYEGETWGSPRIGHALDMIRAGIHVEDVRRAGGWSDAKSVMKYFDVTRCSEPARVLHERRLRTGFTERARVGKAVTADQVRIPPPVCDDLFAPGSRD